jgi:ABC-type branched-subunit amino acid transport system substrate-binding protein
MRKFVVAVPVLALVLGLAAFSDSSGAASRKSASRAPYKLAIVSSLTGSADSNAPSVYGAEAAIDVINSQGGVHGHRIDVTVQDDQSSTTVSPTIGRAVVGANPVAVFDGSIATPAGLSRLPIYESAQIPVFSVTTPGQDFPWLYEGPPTNDQIGVALANAAAATLHNSLKGKKVAIVVAAAPSAEAIGNTIAKQVQKEGGTVTTTIDNPIGAVSFQGAPQIISSGANVAVLADVGSSTILESKALTGAGFTGTIVASYAASDDATLKALGSPKAGAIRLLAYGTRGTGLYSAVRKYKLPATTTSNVYASMNWAMIYMLKDALEKCGFPCAPAKLENKLDALGSFTVPGNILQFGKYAVSRTDHNLTTHVQLYRWDSASNKAIKLGKPVSVGSGS